MKGAKLFEGINKIKDGDNEQYDIDDVKATHIDRFLNRISQR